MRKLVIMFTEVPEIEIRDIPKNIRNEDIERYIWETLDYNPDNLEWQIYDGDKEVAIKIVNNK